MYATTSDYYDYEPIATLQRPVAITGHPGSGLREIVYDLGALTGLTVHDLDHRIAHEVGRSPRQLRHEQGLQAYLQCADSMIPGLLASRPAGLVVLEVGLLELHSQMLNIVRDHADLIFLRLQASAIYWHLRQGHMEDHITSLLPEDLNHPDDLAPLLAASGKIQMTADLILDVTPQAVHAAVTALRDHLVDGDIQGGRS